MSKAIKVSALPKSWILDLDGTLVKHNGYKLDGHDTLLSDAERLLRQIRPEDMVLIITSRKEIYREQTEAFLHEIGLRYDHIIFEAPYGERILINDCKPSGLEMAIAISTKRDEVAPVDFDRDETL